MSTLQPIEITLQVRADPERAFYAFTDRLGEWWPLDDHSVFHTRAAVAKFEDGRIVERSPDGQESVWGSVTTWQPGRAVAFSWHPGTPPNRATNIDVRFDDGPVGSLVTLTHAGWHELDSPEEARKDYEENWPSVLQLFKRCAEGQ